MSIFPFPLSIFHLFPKAFQVVLVKEFNLCISQITFTNSLVIAPTKQTKSNNNIEMRKFYSIMFIRYDNKFLLLEIQSYKFSERTLSRSLSSNFGEIFWETTKTKRNVLLEIHEQLTGSNDITFIGIVSFLKLCCELRNRIWPLKTLNYILPAYICKYPIILKINNWEKQFALFGRLPMLCYRANHKSTNWMLFVLNDFRVSLVCNFLFFDESFRMRWILL